MGIPFLTKQFLARCLQVTTCQAKHPGGLGAIARDSDEREAVVKGSKVSVRQSLYIWGIHFISLYTTLYHFISLYITLYRFVQICTVIFFVLYFIRYIVYSIHWCYMCVTVVGYIWMKMETRLFSCKVSKLIQYLAGSVRFWWSEHLRTLWRNPRLL